MQEVSEHYKVIRRVSYRDGDVIFRIDQMSGRGPQTLPVIAGPKISGDETGATPTDEKCN